MKKPVRHVKNARLVSINEYWPGRYPDRASEKVMLCEQFGTDEQRGIHDGHELRTSLVVSGTPESGMVETLNTVYQIH